MADKEINMDHFDVVIIGAGVSGIGAAVHLKTMCPGKSFAILDGRDAIGGTWDIFRYPGIRSDSDMHTFGFRFKPWKDAKAIADGPAIKDYLEETANEYDIKKHIHFQHLLKSADWSSDTTTWTLTISKGNGEETTSLSCNFLFMCSGYYSYKKAYTPDFPDQAAFQGQVVHPQFWPENLNYTDKKVVVIGSGATAMTIVPNMAKEGAEVTMLQRSPTYVVSRPARDAIANGLRKIFPEKLAYAITRFKNIQLQRFFYGRTRKDPARVKEKLLHMVRKALGDDIVKEHFTPRYNPWDERLCLIPDGDLFKMINEGKARVVTAEIDCFTEKGIKLKNGDELTADIIVTATGLELVVLGEADFCVDGSPVNFADTWTYKGMMFSGVPNMVQTFGYINASWTLRADLTSEYVCRLLNHMEHVGAKEARPQLRDGDKSMAASPWIEDFSPGYMKRVMHLFPKQGDKDPWRNTQNYLLDKKLIRHGNIDDGVLVFSNATTKSGNHGKEAQAVAAS